MNNQNTISTSVLLLLVCFGLLSPKAFGVLPPPDGGYPGQNTAEGQSALLHLAGGTYNTALGWASLGFNVTGNFNTGVGAATLLNNTASENTATGAGALLSNSTGSSNTATGAFALLNNTTGTRNTAVGASALLNDITGTYNTATGAAALFNNATGSFNTANGTNALHGNTTGDGNTATGQAALQNNNVGGENTATGDGALLGNTTGSFNTATGAAALFHNDDSVLNTADGWSALFANTTGSYNTAIGDSALANNTTGSVNIALGDFAGGNLTTGSSNIDIGHPGEAGESDTIRMGLGQTRTFIAGIFGATPAFNGTAVYVNSAGQLYTPGTSAARFKRDIKPMDKSSEGILMFRPVTFHYKSDNTNTPQFGLIAEDVAEVNPDLVVRDEKGGIYTVRYDAVNAMLLNEFLKEHKTVQELKKEIAALRATVREQVLKIQRISDQLELNKPSPQLVDSNK